MVDSAINVGNRPLHGTKLFVMVAISLSLGESMILQAITPAALHPNPMHMVSACLPCAQAFLKKPSRLKATRGKYPRSSSRVNKGKKMAIGGSITDTTHAGLYIYPKREPCSQLGNYFKTKPCKCTSIWKSPLVISSDG